MALDWGNIFNRLVLDTSITPEQVMHWSLKAILKLLDDSIEKQKLELEMMSLGSAKKMF